MSKENKNVVGLTVTKSGDVHEWYTQVVTKSELIDYSPVSGCYVLRPRSYSIWENIMDYTNKLISLRGVKNTYFPLFIPKSLLVKEEDHVEGFSPEVAWVTKTGNSDIVEHLAIRPTSETIMYDTFKRWIRSHRDLPLKINQWANIVRWEFKDTTPFLRSREFLWQEGHTVFETKKEADEEALDILENVYKDVFENLLAVPVITGKKSIKEKFAGADYTLSIECFTPVGKAIQAGTSHHLGQNFAKAFDISFTDADKNKKVPFQNSWGISTRSIGIMILTHSDDKGLVIPPRVALEKCVIVPIFKKGMEDKIVSYCKNVKSVLSEFNPILDLDTSKSPGYKFADWELKGIPLRIEIGPKDIENNKVCIKRRDSKDKLFVNVDDVYSVVLDQLNLMQKDLLNRAKDYLNSNLIEVFDYDTFKKVTLNKQVAIAYHCGSPECEGVIKDELSGVKTLNAPFYLNTESCSDKNCIKCGKPAVARYLFSKSY